MTKDLAKVETTLTKLRCLLDVEPYRVQPRFSMLYGFDTTGTYASETKHVTWNITARRPVQVIHMTDTQCGHVYSNKPQIAKFIKWVLADPDRYVLLGGDMIDAATIMSPGEPWENVCNAQGQVWQFCETFAPLRPRILGYVGGNHERRTIKTFGDAGKLIAALLQIPYSAGQQFINVNFGEHKPFRFFLWHGRGAARTPGAKMQMIYYALRELSGGAHVTLVGHLHTAMLTWATHRVDMGDKVVDRKIVGAMSSSFLEYFGTYAEVAGMSPSDIIMARVDLEPSGKWEISLR